MVDNKSIEVEIQAARALADWKAAFASQVSEEAIKIATRDGTAGIVTLGHYHEAAIIALKSLLIAIQEPTTRHGSKKAA